jgi:RNA polymerase sigma-70 factor (family 1)
MPEHSDLNDFALMSLIKQDNHNAYREIYQRYTGILYAHAYSRLQDREEAKDVVQDVLSHLWFKRHTVVFQTNISGYLYTSLRNKIINKIAHQKIERKYSDSLQEYIDHGSADADQLVRFNQLKKIIEQEVANMPEKMREVFKMSRESHLSHREIAEELGIAEKTVKNQVNKALKILRTRLGLVNFLLFYFFLK